MKTKKLEVTPDKEDIIPSDKIVIDEKEVDGIVVNEKVVEEVIKTVEKVTKKAVKVHYVNPKEFQDEIIKYYESGYLTDNLGNSINKIAHGLSFAPNFINYSYKEDMVGDAIVKMYVALKNKKFKVNKGFSPFSYFTTIAYHAFINRIKKENKQHATIKEYKETMYPELMAEEEGGNKVYVESNKDDEE